jgi:hypothetical protein
MLNAAVPTQVMIVESEDGSEFAVEITDDRADIGTFTDRLKIKAALEATIRVVAKTVHRSVEKALEDDPPSRIAAEFGLKFSTKTPGGVIVGELGGESSILVRLEWDRPPAS